MCVVSGWRGLTMALIAVVGPAVHTLDARAAPQVSPPAPLAALPQALIDLNDGFRRAYSDAKQRMLT